MIFRKLAIITGIVNAAFAAWTDNFPAFMGWIFGVMVALELHYRDSAK